MAKCTTDAFSAGSAALAAETTDAMMGGALAGSVDRYSNTPCRSEPTRSPSSVLPEAAMTAVMVSVGEGVRKAALVFTID